MKDRSQSKWFQRNRRLRRLADFRPTIGPIKWSRNWWEYIESESEWKMRWKRCPEVVKAIRTERDTEEIRKTQLLVIAPGSGTASSLELPSVKRCLLAKYNQVKYKSWTEPVLQSSECMRKYWTKTAKKIVNKIRNGIQRGSEQSRKWSEVSNKTAD